MRIANFIRKLNEKGIGKALFVHGENTPDINVRYFTGTDIISLAVLAVKGKDARLFVPPLEFEKAKRESRVKVQEISKKGAIKDISKFLGKGKRIAVNMQNISFGYWNQIKKATKANAFDAMPICKDLRSIKSHDELQNVRKACKITDLAFESAMRHWREFRTERQVSLHLENFMKSHGTELAFAPIIASGSHSSMPHFETSDSKLKKGFCVMDFGARYKGYCADMTRTIFIGKPKKEDVAIYKLVLDSQKAAIAKIREGVNTQELDLAARKALGRHSSKFIHGLGHGVGLEIHEAPAISSISEDKLSKGMAFTIEPGAYFRGRFGIRIEDTFGLDTIGASYTRSPKEQLIQKSS